MIISILLFAVGLLFLIKGGDWFVDGASALARRFHLPELLIAAITSLVKGHSDLSLGNVVGANVFNLVLVSGISVILAPFSIPQSNTLFGINSSLVLDLPVMLAVMLILTVPALTKKKLYRGQGILMLAIYAALLNIQIYSV